MFTGHRQDKAGLVQDGVTQEVELAGLADEDDAAGGIQDVNAQLMHTSVKISQVELRHGLGLSTRCAVEHKLHAVVGTQGRCDAGGGGQLTAVGAHGRIVGWENDGGAAVGFIGVG